MTPLGGGISSLIPKKGIAPTASSSSGPMPVAPRPGPLAKGGPPASGENRSGDIQLIPESSIVKNPHQPRRHIDPAALDDLVNSIREHGILQPIVVMKTSSGFQLIAGERRVRAANILHLRTIPAIVRDATRHQQLELAIVENVQRKDLNPIERTQAYRRLIQEFGLTQEHVAKRVGKSRATVANLLRLLDLPSEVQQAVVDEKISEGHAKVIASAPNSKEQLQLLHDILAGGLSVRRGEALVKRAVSAGKRKYHPADPELIAAEEELRDVFGTRVRIDRSGKGGKITIEYYSIEELKTLLKRLRRA